MALLETYGPRGTNDSPIRLPRNVAKIARVVVAPNVHEFKLSDFFIVELPPQSKLL